MRILWIKMGGLWPPTSGGRIRSLETLSGLSKRHDVTVLTTHGPGDDPDGLQTKLARCHVESIPFVAPRLGSKAFVMAVAQSSFSPLPVDLWKWRSRAVVDRAQALMTANDFDLCVADFLVAIPNVPKVPGVPKVPLVLFEHNVEYVIWKRLAAVETRRLHKAILDVEWRKMRRFEAAACANADLTIAVSDEDRRGLQSLAPGGRIVATPTGVDTAFFQPGRMPEIPHHLVFSGSMDWYPNEDAILHFGDNILPLIRARVPDVTVTVVGRNPTALLKAAAEKAGIVLTGTVDDVRPFIERGSVYIVPLRAGGGTRLKIFEALAMRKAVVSTTVGAEGLALTDGQDVVIADEPNAFAQAVIRLFEDPFRRESIARAGRELVENRYSWERVTEVFEHYCLSAVAKARHTITPKPAPRVVPHSALGTRH